MELLKKHILFLKYNELPLPNIDIKLCNEYNSVDFQHKIFNLLCSYKNEIEKISNKQKWNYYKKLTNQFEMITINNSRSLDSTYTRGVANIEPISRAYFKLWEIITDLNLIDFSKNKIYVVGLAEGPGGFIECIYDMRKKYSDNNDNDNYTCITLKTDNNKIPDWKNTNKLFVNNYIHKSIDIHYGPAKDGDLYKRSNIEGLSKHIDNKADIVTGDGGFDFSINYSNQEQLSYRLIFCQIVCAFSTLKIGGNFVVKIFDIFTNLNIKLIYFLSTMFLDGIYIIKPFTSRPANSEKYIVCKNFKLTDTSKIIEKIVTIFHKICKNDNIVKILSIEIPYLFSIKIEELNAIYGQQQLDSISNTLNLISNSKTDKIENIKKNNIQKCISWCQKYNLPFNKINFSNNIKLNQII